MSRHGASDSGESAAGRRVGIEFRKFYRQRLASGFIGRFLSGEHVLDIGFSGGDPHAVPVTDSAIGVGLDYRSPTDPRTRFSPLMSWNISATTRKAWRNGIAL